MLGLRTGIKTGLRGVLANGLSADEIAKLATWRLQKSGGVDGTYDGQAYTSAIFTGTTLLSFTIDTVSGAGDAFALGLSADNPDANYTGIDFALVNDVGTMYRSANGVTTSLGATVPGDRWIVRRTMPGGVVDVIKNGAVVIAFLATSVAALLVDTSMRFTNDRVINVGVVHDGAYPALSWTVANVTATQE